MISSEEKGNEGADKLEGRIFSSSGMHSRVGDLWPWTRNDEYQAARFSQGRSSFGKSRGESFRSCAQGLANAKPFHRRDYGTSIFSARDPVAVTPPGKVKKKRRRGKRYPDETKYEGLIRLANRNVLLYWDGTTLFDVFVKQCACICSPIGIFISYLIIYWYECLLH